MVGGPHRVRFRGTERLGVQIPLARPFISKISVTVAHPHMRVVIDGSIPYEKSGRFMQERLVRLQNLLHLMRL